MIRWLAPSLALSCSGCFSLMADAQAGAVSSARFEAGRYGAAVQAAGGLNIGADGAEHLGPGGDVRVKWTGDMQQLGLGPHLYWLHSAWTTPYARVGATAIELGVVDGDTSIGALGPRAELGMFFGLFVISAFAEYDLRWTHQPHEGFVGLMLGYGTAVTTAPLHD
ncbi:MAG: hypothetical protein HS104_31370 [Polyangiaceae bacterium]|nr:hypothetical protein [Polyangiaceae bacterium]MCE7891220.1 hypothetical protein [Sorangiineae bacterium PRO1]MCL4750744.1 hypothetical protein [Myxococcales bacterium]